MTTRTIAGWVLHKKWSGDTSAQVSFFTRELGVIQCLYKGGRTPKKQALLQPFTPLWINLVERRERYYAQTVESTSPSLQLAGSSLFAGLYINEILYYALSRNYSDPALFDAYLFTLNGLTLAKERLVIEALLRRFEWALLHACGYSFSLTQEAGTANSIVPNSYYQFVAGAGFILDSKGIPGEHILALAQNNLNEVLYLKSAKMIMRQAIDHLLGGREIKTRALYLADVK
ncbi:DNA repair protein RecO [Fluoribacter gormanii]|uniref:DNA repair protein RecO n=1 Tax=Fluoribacter gormanii TaxID=464 RepID=A0A377GK56_9GAMM|nr:DNA repair protein RecO [Fluoribacter gormanii]KTD02512.1 DNA repair protein RecO [Fluoribacter gormanii]MCW8443268.1 DNA repair protein RecO [Fluoribacter gormanii]MCW8471694.1 DNA repair protein RecO [Fluoribacter gormanii]SIR44968.1 DNA replication and repair protein RecO [Fluoribacter gormanii]STO25196.1 Recombination protein O [Fluoribacter gormanii]